MNPQLQSLQQLGQSIWYDNLSRAVLSSGELKQMIDSGVMGLTSNPTIFHQAIAESNDYDTDIEALAKKNKSAHEICEELMIADVAAAADLLLPVYTSSKGIDGFASIEVSPLLASDTRSTIEEAKRLWTKLNRPNIMIKVPGTKEGLPAVRSLLEEGINVNITLIFSVEAHQQVMEAYIAALETRAKQNLPCQNIRSVASFFVSRVDAICEKRFAQLVADGKAEEAQQESFLGKVGIANSKLAYSEFERIFSSDRFTALRANGAKVQRPLWASTGTKNPNFNPLLYLEELAGKDTVNTLPPKTLKILIDGGNIAPKLHDGLEEAQAVVEKVNSMGLPLNQFLDELQVAGVSSFADSYKALVDSIEEKRSKFANN